MKKITVYLVAILIIGCNNSKDQESQQQSLKLEKELIGDWQTIYLNVITNSRKNSDQNDTSLVGYGEWEQVVRIKPIRSSFRADGTWNSPHYTLKDSLFYHPSGKWWVKNDTLTLLQTSPSPDTSFYAIAIKNDTASFRATLDWDTDGKKDDLYFGKQVKVKP